MGCDWEEVGSSAGSSAGCDADAGADAEPPALARPRFFGGIVVEKSKKCWVGLGRPRSDKGGWVERGGKPREVAGQKGQKRVLGGGSRKVEGCGEGKGSL